MKATVFAYIIYTLHIAQYEYWTIGTTINIKWDMKLVCFISFLAHSLSKN